MFEGSRDEYKQYDHNNLEFLNLFGQDLVKTAGASNRAKPVVGREKEIELMIETLCRETKSNPILVGGAGVGKTALAEGLAYRIHLGEVPEKLKDSRLFSVRTSTLIAGCTYYGMIEKRINNLLAEAKQSKVIIFLDEIHTIVGSSPRDSTDISQQLKPALSRGDIRCIGATTDEEYRRFIEPDAALARRFQPIRVPELTPEQTMEVLRQMREALQRRTGIEINDKILRMMLNNAGQFMRNRHFPDKAVDLLDQTAAWAQSNNKQQVSVKDAAKVIQRMIGLPADLNQILFQLDEVLERKNLLPAAERKQFGDLLRLSMPGLNVSPQKPNAVLLLLSETGGTAEMLAETVAAALFGAKDRVVKLNFTALTYPGEFNQMLGLETDSRQVNHNAPLSQISKMPWCVILCQSLESCAPEIREMWGKALENGYLTDASGKKNYLSDAVIVAEGIIPAAWRNRVGFGTGETTADLHERLEKYFGKSILKATDFIVFADRAETGNPLKIWLRETLMDNLAPRFAAQNIHLHWDQTIIEALWQKQGEAKEIENLERLINFWLLPALLPLLENDADSISVKVKFENEQITLETTKTAAGVSDRLRSEIWAKRDLYEKFIYWFASLYPLQKEADFSKLTLKNAAGDVEIYFAWQREKLILSFLTKVTSEVKEDATYKFLLEKNARLRHGKFILETDGAVWLEYTVFAENTDFDLAYMIVRQMDEIKSKYREIIGQQNSLKPRAAEWLESKRVKK